MKKLILATSILFAGVASAENFKCNEVLGQSSVRMPIINWFTNSA
jgi:hypothetical protein